MANKKANKKVSAKSSKQQPRSEAPKRKVRTKVTPCLCMRKIGDLQVLLKMAKGRIT